MEFLTRDELDVVDQQQVRVPQPLLETDRVVFLQRTDKLDHELFGGHGYDASAAILLQESVADRVQEVSFASARAAVNEKRIEADGLAGRQRARGGCGDLIGLPDDERLKAVARIEVRRVWIAL